MALKQLILAKKIEQKRSEVNDTNTELEALNVKKTELELAIEEAENEEDVTVVEEEANNLDEEVEAKNKEIEALEDEIADLEKQLEELNNKPDEAKGEKRNMVDNNKELNVREAINQFVHTRGTEKMDPELRAQFTTTEGEALIPVQTFTREVEKNEEFDFSKYVNIVAVNTNSGVYPKTTYANDVLPTVEELAKNPELAVPSFTEVDYKVATHRGYVPISQEVIDDAEYDVVGLIADDIEHKKIRTKNAKIIEAIKGMPGISVDNLDLVKTMFNTAISKKYTNVKALVSASLYNALDQMKDTDGRYLLQPNVTTTTGYSLFGKEVIVIDDDIIGENEGDMVGFFGDLKAAVTLFDRKKDTVKWVDHDVYGQMLAAVVRFGVNTVDEDAGYYVTYTGTPGAALSTVAGA